jgi:hypothetical protein
VSTLGEGPDSVGGTLRRARMAKESLAEGEGGAVLPTVVEAYRGGRLVAVARAPAGDTGLGLKAAATFVHGLGAEEVRLVIEVLGTTEPVNPLTGQPWQRDEMRALVEASEPEAAALQGAVVVTAATERGVEEAVQAFSVGDTGHLEWGEPFRLTGSTGYANGAMRDAFEAPTAAAMFAAIGLAPPPQDVTDDETCRFLAERGLTVALVCGGGLVAYQAR